MGLAVGSLYWVLYVSIIINLCFVSKTDYTLIFSLHFKNESRFMKSAVCLSACPLQIQ
jgi:hypothetical protein